MSNAHNPLSERPSGDRPAAPAQPGVAIRHLVAVRPPVKGDRVWQPTYGCGTVTEVDEVHVRIDFDDHGVRLFAKSIATLLPTRVPPPAPSAVKRTPKGVRRSVR